MLTPVKKRRQVSPAAAGRRPPEAVVLLPRAVGIRAPSLLKSTAGAQLVHTTLPELPSTWRLSFTTDLSSATPVTFFKDETV